MKLRSLLISSTAIALLAVATPAFAQVAAPTAPAAPAVVSAPAAGPVTVNFSTLANLPTLTNKTAKDTFDVIVDGPRVRTELDLLCQAGASRFLVLSQDKECEVTGVGLAKNPNNPAQTIQRTTYTGGFTVKKDLNGQVDATTLNVLYAAMGNAGGGSTTFGGEMKLKPELSASGLQAVAQATKAKFGLGEGVIDDRLDTIELNGFTIPSAAWGDDGGTSWTGSMVFSYAANQWFIDVVATHEGQTYAFKGNMIWNLNTGVNNQTRYELNLPLVTAAGEDLFGGGDLFATVPGITGTITMDEAAYVMVKVDGVEEEIASKVNANGTLIGTEVPVDVVHSFSTLYGVLASNLFGA